MKFKVKITTLQYGVVKTLIIYVNGWYNIINDLTSAGTMLDSIIRIERVFEADAENIIDHTV